MMASMNDLIENGQAFDRLVNRRFQNSLAAGIEVNAIRDIEQRARTLAQAQRAHYKKHFERFVEQETHRQIQAMRGKTEGQPPAVSKRDFERARSKAVQVVNDRYAMKLLKVDQASERMQLRAIGQERQVSDVTRAYRIKERGASLANRLKAHHRKHFNTFVDKQAQKDLAAHDQSFRQKFKTEHSAISIPELQKMRKRSEAKVTKRHEQRLLRIERAATKMHQRQLKQAKQTHQQRM